MDGKGSPFVRVYNGSILFASCLVVFTLHSHDLLGMCAICKPDQVMLEKTSWFLDSKSLGLAWELLLSA